MRRFSSKGSPTCTLGRLASSASDSEKPAKANTLTPPIPSRPVVEPNNRQVAHAAGLAEHQPLHGQGSQAQDVHQRVLLVGGVEDGFAADGGDADGIAVPGDPAHHALGDPAAAGVVERPESQRVHQRDGSGAHGEDVSENAPGAGGCSLVRLDGRRVVVALDADGHGDVVAHIEDAGVLAGADQDAGTLGREPTEMQPGGLVGAVLGPHDRVHRQLEMVGSAPEDAFDLGGLGIGEAQRAVKGILGDVVHACKLVPVGRGAVAHRRPPTRR